jgi:hypothetical protein
LETLRQQLRDEKMLRSNYENAVRCLEYSIEMATSNAGQKEPSSRGKLLNLFSCSKCSPVSSENKLLKKEIDALKCKLDKANANLSQNVDWSNLQVEDCAKYFYEKENLSREIEELTAALFDEANKMVAYEKKLRTELEKANVQLSIELTAAMNKMGADLRKQVIRLSKSIVYNEAPDEIDHKLKKNSILEDK